jgi:hypothetical protein
MATDPPTCKALALTKVLLSTMALEAGWLVSLSSKAIAPPHTPYELINVHELIFAVLQPPTNSDPPDPRAIL